MILKSVVCMILCTILGVFSQSQMAHYKPYTEKRVRAVTLIDAFAEYQEDGRPKAMGVFVDKKLNFEFEYPIRYFDLLKFQSNQKERDMTVNTSLSELRYPGTPAGATGFPVLMILSGLGFLGSAIAILIGLCRLADEKADKARRDKYRY